MSNLDLRSLSKYSDQYCKQPYYIALYTILIEEMPLLLEEY
jgi:hypothetical protein